MEYAKYLLKLTKAHIMIMTAEHLQQNAAVPNDAANEIPLSARELEVLKLLAAKCSNQEIAEELLIMVRTVKHHNVQIYEKMKVKNWLEAIIRAKKLGLT